MCDINKEIFMTESIINALNKITNSGFSAKIVNAKSTKSGVKTYFSLFRKGNNKELRIVQNHYYSYNGSVNEWSGVSEDFGVLNFEYMNDVDLLLEKACELI